MRKTRYTEEQIIGILKEVDAGVPIVEVCWKYGISDAKKLKHLDDENRRLSK